MVRENLANELFDAWHKYSSLKEELCDYIVEEVLKIGDDDSWPFDDVTHDWYDSSFELKDCKHGFDMTPEQLQMMWDVGFERCWFVFSTPEPYKGDFRKEIFHSKGDGKYAKSDGFTWSHHEEFNQVPKYIAEEWRNSKPQYPSKEYYVPYIKELVDGVWKKRYMTYDEYHKR